MDISCLIISFFTFTTVCLFTFNSIPPPSSSQVSSLLGPDPLSSEPSLIDWEIAHRAAPENAPENSLEAVQDAADKGAKWIEFDVSFTADDVPIVFHDKTVDRVTNGSSSVSSYTFNELMTLDLGTTHSFNLTGVRIPSAMQFITLCLSLDIKMIIDLKSWSSPFKTRNFVISLFKTFPQLSYKAMVTSFYPHLLYAVRSLNPNIICSLSSYPNLVPSGLRSFYPNFTDGLTQRLVGLSAILLHKTSVTEEVVTFWADKGVRVIAWTVNTCEEKTKMKNKLKVQVLTDIFRNCKS